MLFELVLFLVGIFFLVKGADYVVEKGVKIGSFLGLPKFFIGATLIAFGTSLPEFISSFFAAMKGNTAIVFSNIAGSNIANIFLILGVLGVISKKVKIKTKQLYLDFALMFLISSLFLFFSWDGSLFLYECIFLLSFSFYFFITYKPSKKSEKPSFKDVVFFILGFILLYIGGDYTIEYLIKLSMVFRISPGILATFLLALGTSLPELVVSVVSYLKNEKEVSVGNIIGSNILNISFIIGIIGIFFPIYVIHKVYLISMVFIIASLFSFYYVFFIKKEMSFFDSLIFIFMYFLFVFSLFL